MDIHSLYSLTCPKCQGNLEVLDRDGGETDLNRSPNFVTGYTKYEFFMRARCNDCFDLWEYEINIRKV